MATTQPQSKRIFVPWIYDLGIWIFTLCLGIFFREVHPSGVWRVPKHGPLIIVAAPHANQFVDSFVLMRILKSYVGRRICFLIAQKSMNHPYIGTLAAAMGALPVVRAMDLVKPGKGTIYLPDPEHEPTLVRGRGTDFTHSNYMIGGTIILPKAGKGSPDEQVIEKIIGPEELLLRKPFKTLEAVQMLSNKDEGTAFKIAPRLNQGKMFDSVFRELLSGGCIGIFPEGGSHDRSD